MLEVIPQSSFKLLLNTSDLIKLYYITRPTQSLPGGNAVKVLSHKTLCWSLRSCLLTPGNFVCLFFLFVFWDRVSVSLAILECTMCTWVASQLTDLLASGIKVLQHQYLAQSGNSYTPVYLIILGFRQFIPMNYLGNWLRGDCVCVLADGAGRGGLTSINIPHHRLSQQRTNPVPSFPQTVHPVFIYTPDTPGESQYQTTKTVNIILCTPTDLG